MATDNLRICSLNANGMRDHSKRAQLFTWLKIKKFDIVFLQETHCKSYSDSKLWEKKWGGSCFWSFDGSRSRGTCIIFREDLPFTKQRFYYDAVGRLVLVDASMYGSCYRLINVYAPNNHAERIQWLNHDAMMLLFCLLAKCLVIFTIIYNEQLFTCTDKSM